MARGGGGGGGGEGGGGKGGEGGAGSGGIHDVGQSHASESAQLPDASRCMAIGRHWASVPTVQCREHGVGYARKTKKGARRAT
jgi:hypothetical protein